MFGRRKHEELTNRLDQLTEALESIHRTMSEIVGWLDDERQTNRAATEARGDQMFAVRRELSELRDMLGRLSVPEIAEFLSARQGTQDSGEFDQELVAACWALDRERLAELAQAMPDTLSETASKLLTMDAFILAAVSPLVEALQQRLDDRFQPTDRDELLADLIAATAPPENWPETIGALRSQSPDGQTALLDAAAGKLVDIADLVRVDDDAIRRLLREVEMSDLVAALSKQPGAVVQRVLRAMARRLSEMVAEDIELAEGTPEADVTAARRRINNILRRLQRAGIIYFHADAVEITQTELDDLLTDFDPGPDDLQTK